VSSQYVRIRLNFNNSNISKMTQTLQEYDMNKQGILVVTPHNKDAAISQDELAHVQEYLVETMHKGEIPIISGADVEFITTTGARMQYPQGADSTYLKVARDILEFGVQKGDRTGTGTISTFGKTMRFDLTKGFPLLTTKKIHWKSVVHELLWFISGDTNIKYLKDNGVRIWDEWADENGDLGPVYGKQWRDFLGIDQLADVIEQIKKNPDSRRLVVSAWNPADVGDMALPPCHMFFQFYVEPLREGETKRRLSCQLYQRSCDWFLGVPFNIASYALLTHLIAHVTDLEVGEFVWTGGDCHIYNDHIEQIKEQLSRPLDRPMPTIQINHEVRDINAIKFEDITLSDYNPYPAIKAKVSV